MKPEKATNPPLKFGDQNKPAESGSSAENINEQNLISKFGFIKLKVGKDSLQPQGPKTGGS